MIGTASRVDFLLTGGGRPPAFVEVKNCISIAATAWRSSPIPVAARGARHLKALSREVAKGARAVMLRGAADRPPPTSASRPTSTRATPWPPAWPGTPGSKPGAGRARSRSTAIRLAGPLPVVP